MTKARIIILVLGVTLLCLTFLYPYSDYLVSQGVTQSISPPSPLSQGSVEITMRFKSKKGLRPIWEKAAEIHWLVVIGQASAIAVASAIAFTLARPRANG
jgi:hypothetical protein